MLQGSDWKRIHLHLESWSRPAVWSTQCSKRKLTLSSSLYNWRILRGKLHVMPVHKIVEIIYGYHLSFSAVCTFLKNDEGNDEGVENLYSNVCPPLTIKPILRGTLWCFLFYFFILFSKQSHHLCRSTVGDRELIIFLWQVCICHPVAFISGCSWPQHCC